MSGYRKMPDSSDQVIRVGPLISQLCIQLKPILALRRADRDAFAAANGDGLISVQVLLAPLCAASEMPESGVHLLPCHLRLSGSASDRQHRRDSGNRRIQAAAHQLRGALVTVLAEDTSWETLSAAYGPELSDLYARIEVLVHPVQERQRLLPRAQPQPADGISRCNEDEKLLLRRSSRVSALSGATER